MRPMCVLGIARVLVGLVAVGLATRVTAQSSPALTPATFLALLERYRQGDLDSLSDAARFRSRDVARVAAAMRGGDQASARATLVFTLDLTRMAPVQEVAGRPRQRTVAWNFHNVARRPILRAITWPSGVHPTD